MSKTKKLKVLIVSALSAALMLCTGFALGELVPASAEEPVLDGNTATFTVENDMTTVNQNDDSRWTYDRETNEWRSSKKYGKIKNGTSIKLTVVEPGNMVFSWKVGSSSGNTSVLITKTHAEEEVETIVDKKELTSSVWKEYTSYSSPVTISNLQNGDVVEFKWTSNSSTSSSSYCLMIKGLNPPTNQFSITAKVAADSIDHGTIKTEKPEETFDESSHQLIAQRGYCESVTFTAVPEDGYTAYWKSSDGKFVSHVAEFTVSNITQSKDDGAYVYTVYFVKLDENGTKISFDDPGEGKAHFEKSQQDEIDVYTVADLKNLTKNDTVSLYIEFTGEKYVSYERVMVKTGSLSALFDGCSVDGESKTITNGSECIYFHVTGEGYHVIRITVKFSDFGLLGSDERSAIQDGDSYTIKNIRFQESGNPFTETITVKYNPHYSELYYNGALQEAEDTNVVIETTLTVPLADEYTIQLKPKAEVTSSLDPLQMAEVVYKNGTANATYYYGSGGDGEYRKPAFQSQADKSVTFTISRFDNQYAINTKLDGSTAKKSFNLDEGAETLVLEINYMERAPIPKVSAIKTIDNEETEIESITDGQVIDFPFLHNNSLSIRIQKIEGLAQTDFSVLVNNVERNASLQDYENIFLLPIQDVGNTQVVIRYLKSSETIDFSAYSLSFRLGEFPEEDKNGTDITKAVHLDENSGRASLDMTAMDMVSYNKPPRWLFDPELSAEGNYAYTTTSQVNQNGEYYQGESNLKYITFELSGEAQGSLTFQFRASGYIGQEVLSGSYRGGLLYAAPQSAVNSLSNYKPYCTSSDGIKWTDPDSAVTLLAKPRPEGGMEYGSTVVPLDDGWYQASVPIKQGFANNIYLLFITYYPTNSSYPIDRIPIASASIRDVRVVTGEKTVSVSTSAEADDATATVTVGDVQHQNGSDSFKVNAGTMVNLSADTKGKKFYGWSVNGQLVSTEPNASIFINADSVIKAWIADEGTYEARTEGTFYTSIVEAVNAASSGQTVIVIEDGATIETSFEIKTGVTLLLPYSNENKLTATGTPDVNSKDRIAWIKDSATYRYLTVTVKGNVTITVSGTLAVGGIVNYPKGQGYQGHTSGAYAELILETGSKIQVAKGGVMDVYGRVWGGEGHEGTDMGTIDVADGGKLYQPFLILDYTGGTNALGLFMAGQTPFRRYAMINIEVPTTINYGGMLYGHASLWIETFKMLASLDQPFVSYYMGEKLGGDGNGNDTFVMLHDGASVTITYDPTKVIGSPTTADCTEGIGKIKMVFEGGADFSYMLFSAMGISVPTNSVYFSIPYNYEVEMNDFAVQQGEVHAQYVTKTDFMLMPGAIVKVGKGATLTLNANTWIYDGLEQKKLSGKGYPTATQLNGIYSKSGNLIVDGTLKIGQKTTVQQFELFEPAEPFVPKIIPALFLGIIQTNGTGTIIIPEGTELSGQIVDGANGTNYFAYTTTARVWDAAHSCFGDLKAGHTYTAKDGDSFTLDALKYTNAEGGEENQTLSLNSDMVGSWMIEHDAHTFDWSQLTAEETNLGNAKYKDLDRQCTELGCTDREHKLLLSEEFSLSGTYKGSEFSGDDVLKLFYQYYFGSTTVLDEVLENCEFSASVSTGNNQSIRNAAAYNNLTVTLTNGFFGGNATNTSKTFDFTVEKFNVANLDQAAIEKSLSGLVYNGEAHTPDLTLRAEGLTGAVSHAAFDWQNNTNAGEDTASVTIKGSGENFTGILTVNFSIAKATLTVNVVDKTKTYDGTAWAGVENAQQTTDFTVADGQIYKSDDIGLRLTVGASSADVGDYTVTGEASNPNYTVTVTEGTYKITRAPLTVNIEKKGHTYGEEAVQLSYTLDGVQNEEEGAIKKLITLQSTGAEQWQTVGKYDITAWYSSSEIKNTLNAENDDVLKNYTVTVSGGTNAYTVKAKDISGATFTVTTPYTYDNTAKQPGVEDIAVTLGGYDGDHKVTFTVGNYQNNIDATTNGASLTVTATGNFSGTKEVTFTIRKATVTAIEITNKDSLAYNGTELTPTIVVKSGALTLVAGDYTVAYKHSTKQDIEVKNAGEYTVTVTLTDECKNYQLGDVTTATFTVAKAEITITADNQHTPQGEPILSGDKLTWTVTKTPNGKGEFFEDDRATLKEHITVTTTADKDTVAESDIIIGWLNAYVPDNYTVTFKNGTYYVDDTIWKNVSVTGWEQAIKYDGKEHKLTITVGNDELLDGKTTITQTFGEQNTPFTGAKNVGTYEVTVTIKAQGYTSSFTGKYTITITAREVTVTFNPESSAYGDDVKTDFTYETSGDTVLTDDNTAFEAAITAANPHTDAEKTSHVSDGQHSYKITTENTPELQNYTITVKDGVYTITARPITVTVNKQTVTYNQKLQSAQSRHETDWTVTDLAEGDEASELNVKLTANATDAGKYDITATWSNTNYAVTFKGADGLTVADSIIKEAFVIEAAALTEATVNGSYTYDGTEQTPTFTVKAEGDLTVKEGDFTIDYTGADRVSAGTVNVTVKAKSNNYSGEVGAQFTIGAKHIKVTLNKQEVEYSGEVPTPDSKAYTVDEQELCSKNGKKDDLGVVITLVAGNKDHGDYELKATASNTDYDVEFDATAKLTVKQKELTVKANDLWSYYGDTPAELTYTAEGLIEGEQAKDVLNVKLQADRTIEEAGTYNITGTGSATNYTFDVQPGTYTVKEREITVKIIDQTSLYDGTEPSVSQKQEEGWTITDGNIIVGDDLHLTFTKDEGADAGDYAINGAFTNDNYNVTFVGTLGTAGKFTVNARTLTVFIEDQKATYDFEHNYDFHADEWYVKDDGDGLAENEEKDVLAVTLTKPTLTDVGTYAIEGAWDNGNYTVTFEGSYEGGEAGVYTVEKQDVSKIARFFLTLDTDFDTEGDRTIHVKFASKDGYVYSGRAYVNEGEDQKELTVEIDPAKLTEIGEFEVTVTVNDKNYSGSTVFTVIATDADGYTKNLLDTLDRLAELAEGLDAAHLTADDYEKLVAILEAINGLNEDEREVGASQLAEYQALVDAWNELADIDDVVATAKTIANAPIDALFASLAAISALTALAYIVTKGGIL